MQPSKRQLQVARQIEESLNTIFTKNAWTMIHGGMVTISQVQVTPDLLEARIYLSMFKIEDKNAVLKLFVERTAEIRGALGNQMRHQLRRIPTLDFFIDDTLDYVYKIENLFEQIKEEDKRISSEINKDQDQ